MLKVSVVTPSFNQDEFLEKTIKSVITQDYDNIEYIVIDGGSSDGSVEIIRKYEHNIKYWVSEKDNGQSHAINKGFTHCTGDIICWLNSDDVFEKSAIRKIVELFETYPDIDIIYGATYTIDQSDKIMFARHEISFDINVMLFTMNFIPQSSTFWRKSVYDKVGGLREDLHYTMDHEYWLRFYKASLKFMYIDEFFSYYRWHGNSKGTINSHHINDEKKQLRNEYANLSRYSGIAEKIYPVVNFVFRVKRQIVKIVKYGRFEIIPQNLVRAYLKNVKGHFKEGFKN